MVAAELHDGTSAVVKAALDRPCEVCRAKPGELCRNTLQPHLPLPGRRLVHYARTAE